MDLIWMTGISTDNWILAWIHNVSKVYVTQEYEADKLAFREPVNLSVRLKSGKWYAVKASIEL